MCPLFPSSFFLSDLVFLFFLCVFFVPSCVRCSVFFALLCVNQNCRLNLLNVLKSQCISVRHCIIHYLLNVLKLLVRQLTYVLQRWTSAHMMYSRSHWWLCQWIKQVVIKLFFHSAWCAFSHTSPSPGKFRASSMLVRSPAIVVNMTWVFYTYLIFGKWNLSISALITWSSRSRWKIRDIWYQF